MIRNPSELARLEEERQELLQILINKTGTPPAIYGVADKGFKSGREKLLEQLRRIERELGIPHVNYNSSEFAKQLDDVVHSR